MAVRTSDLNLPADTILSGADGFKYFSPGPTWGLFSSYHLRQIADKLDELNEPWQQEIERYFKEHPDDLEPTCDF